jgi:polyisoprenoid-binding protein YceI
LKQFVIDKRASRFTVRAFAGGVGAGLGYGPTLTIGDFCGEAQFDPLTLEEASLWVKIKAASIMVAEEMREDDRHHLEALVNQEILKTSRFPEVSFHSLRISPVEVTKGLYRMDVAGELTLNGVCRPQGFAMQVAPSQHDVRAYGDFSIRQSEYDIPQVVIAGGLLQLQDELKFCFYILARSQSPTPTQDCEEPAAANPEAANPERVLN